MIRIPTHRAPTHPGEMLLEEFLKPMGITQRKLADAIKVPYPCFSCVPWFLIYCTIR